MLTQLNLRNFKCFELLRLPLGPLTLLSGANASGKSSIIQSLVLLHQNMREHEWSTRLSLNGSVTRLGTLTDVMNQIHGRDSFSIGLIGSAPDWGTQTDDDISCNWSFTGERRDMSLAVSQVAVNGQMVDNPSHLQHLLPVSEFYTSHVRPLTLGIRDLTYITAGREGPREVYPLEDQYVVPTVGPTGESAVEDQYVVTTVGPTGENAVSVLYRRGDEPIQKKLRLQGVARTLFHQVQARLDTFFPGCALEVQQVPKANAVTMGIRTSPATDFLRPIHCGFGITQILPIIVAALSVAKGNLLLIENPEVHLHPSGQALMGQFLAEVAHAGVQVIVETHSDHVLNGIRRAVKSERIPAEEVAIYFLQPWSPDLPQVISPTLDSSGSIDDWPKGFFDQFDKDLDYFAGWGE